MHDTRWKSIYNERQSKVAETEYKNVNCSKFLNPNGRDLARKQQSSDLIRLLDPASQRNNRKEAESSNGDSNGSLGVNWSYLSILSELERHGSCDRVLDRTFKDFLGEAIPVRIPCKERNTKGLRDASSILVPKHAIRSASHCIIHLSGKIPFTCRVKQEFKYILASS